MNTNLTPMQERLLLIIELEESYESFEEYSTVEDDLAALLENKLIEEYEGVHYLSDSGYQYISKFLKK